MEKGGRRGLSSHMGQPGKRLVTKGALRRKEKKSSHNVRREKGE